VQPLQERQELLEILEILDSRDLGLTDLLATLAWRGAHLVPRRRVTG